MNFENCAWLFEAFILEAGDISFGGGKWSSRKAEIELAPLWTHRDNELVREQLSSEYCHSRKDAGKPLKITAGP